MGKNAHLANSGASFEEVAEERIGERERSGADDETLASDLPDGGEI